MAEAFTINSPTSLLAFNNYVEKLWAEHKYLTFDAPRIGADRSLNQNALFHVWASEYVAYRLNKNKKGITRGELDGMKRIIKTRYAATHPDSFKWMVYEIVNPFNGEKKKDYTSSTTWKRGEMYLVLTWFQMVAAEDGLILEAKGEFAKLQRKETEV